MILQLRVESSTRPGIFEPELDWMLWKVDGILGYVPLVPGRCFDPGAWRSINDHDLRDPIMAPKIAHATSPSTCVALGPPGSFAAQIAPETVPTVNSGKPISNSLSPSESSTSSGGKRVNRPVSLRFRSKCSWMR